MKVLLLAAMDVVDIPASGSPDESTSPQTGDSADLIFWIALVFIGSLGFIGAEVYGKRKGTR